MTYRDILQSDYFFNTYTTIEVMKRDFPVNHGCLHVWHVIQNAKYLADIFDLTEKERGLLLISATLHDIGYIKGRENHASSGAVLAREYLQGKMSDEDIEKICDAIANHGGERPECYVDKVSRCLVFADKLDFDNTRYRYDELSKESIVVYLSIQKVEFVKKKDFFEFAIYTNDLTLFKDYQERHFFKKLARVFDNFEQATQKEIMLKFYEVEKGEEKERRSVHF